MARRILGRIAPNSVSSTPTSRRVDHLKGKRKKKVRQPGIEPGAKQWECLSLPLTHWRWSMGALLNVSIFMEPLSNCTCCEARQIPILPVKAFPEIYPDVIFSYQSEIQANPPCFQIAFQNFKWRSRLKARQPKYLFSPDTQHAYLSKGRGVVAQCERRRPSKKDGWNLRTRTWIQTEPPGEPRHREVHESTRETAFGKKELFRGRLTNSRVGYSAQGGTAGVRARFV